MNTPPDADTEELTRFLHRFADLMSTGTNADNLLYLNTEAQGYPPYFPPPSRQRSLRVLRAAVARRPGSAAAWLALAAGPAQSTRIGSEPEGRSRSSSSYCCQNSGKSRRSVDTSRCGALSRRIRNRLGKVSRPSAEESGVQTSGTEPFMRVVVEEDLCEGHGLCVDIAPEVFRERNFLHTGDTTATGQTISQDLDLAGLQRRALTHACYFEKRARFRNLNKTANIKKGIGFATFFHGAGFTGSGERYLQSIANLRATQDGRVEILCSMTEMGQGTNTVLTQVAAETLRIPYEWVTILRPDTSRVPNSGPTVASRTTMIIGRLVENASKHFLTDWNMSLKR